MRNCLRGLIRCFKSSRFSSIATTADVDSVKEMINDDNLVRLRSIMKQHQLDAYFVPSEDAHQSEYLAHCDKRRAYLTGFTGSAGHAVVTVGIKNGVPAPVGQRPSQSIEIAALWTDGRYFLQAERQLSPAWTLMRSGLPDVPSKEDWLPLVLANGCRVGVDPRLITFDAAKSLRDTLKKHGLELVAIEQNLIDAIWLPKAPPRTLHPVLNHPLQYSGVSSADKLAQLRNSCREKQTMGFVVTALDEIAWLFNLRGSDIEFNPVFFAYALVTQDEVTLYCDHTQLPAEIKDIKIRPYNSIYSDLKAAKVKSTGKLWVAPSCNWALVQSLGEDNVILAPSPVQQAKAIKNAVECEGFRQSHLRDAAALCQFFAWLEERLKAGDILNEVDAADKLESFRVEQKDFVGLSFDTISGSGPNGAIIHYKPERETCAIIRPDLMYLCDSGGQYKDGTTDVTRTLHFGQPTEHERRCYTRVLQGHIAIDRVVFPEGTTGYVLDTLARVSLWQDGLNFRHGVGHGVGSFLNVHEGPQGIGQRIAYNDVPLKRGMTVTNEPGYYEDGQFGIRIENVMIVKEVETPHRFGNIAYLGLEHVTLVPMQNKLIVVELLTPDERAWVNAYHAEVREKVGTLLPPNSPGYAWLIRETEPL